MRTPVGLYNWRAREVYSRDLAARGRLEEAIAQIKIAIDLEPTSRFNQRLYGNYLMFERRFAEALAQYKRVMAMDENFRTDYEFLCQTSAMQGNYADAFECQMQFLAAVKADEETIQNYRLAYLTSGWKGVLRENVKRFDADKAYYYYGAIDYAAVGDKEKAFEYLEKSFERRELWMSYLQVDLCFDSLRGDPRFKDFVARVESGNLASAG